MSPFTSGELEYYILGNDSVGGCTPPRYSKLIITKTDNDYKSTQESGY